MSDNEISESRQELNDQQAIFLDLYLQNGATNEAGEDAAKKAGYAKNGKNWRNLLKSKAIGAALREHISENLKTGAVVATEYLVKTISDETAPRAARNDAAKTILNRAGIVEKKDHNKAENEDKPLNEMSVSELEAAIESMSQVIDKAKDSQAIEVEAPTVTPTKKKE